MIKQAIYQLSNKENLTAKQASLAMQEIMEGRATNAQIASFLMGLRIKGETIEEITALAKVMRAKAQTIEYDEELFEIVGTGGDEANTFNISTTAGFVVSASGIKVAKHGNRSVSSKCGAADCLEALGTNLSLNSEQNKKMLDETGMCFMFAPNYHSSMKYASPVRRELGIRTVFNILGPLINPAKASRQLMGVYKEELVEPLARVLANLGVKRGAVVHGYDGLDEITACNKTLVCEINEGIFYSYTLDPQEYEMEYARPQELVGGDKIENAQITKSILAGEKSARRNAVVLNAGMSIYLAKDDISLRDSIHLAEELIDTGRAIQQMEHFVQYSHEVC